MDFSEPTKLLFARILKLEPENPTKILGYLLFHEERDQLAKLIISPEHYFQQVILQVKTQLSQLGLARPVPSLAPSRASSSQFWDRASSDVFAPFSESPSLELQDPIESFYQEARANRRLFSGDFPAKTCHYFNKGFCKHGSSCRYLHGQAVPEIYGSDTFAGDDQVFSPGSLEKLELEIVELLKSRRGNPVSIASLPAMYYEKYGKYLQAEGYLTESQRHGKAGYSLTKLLARLKNTIRLIDRPHGQHAVILAEDAMKYMDNRGEKSDPGPIVSGSRQIYLTFPAESTFTEEDVSNYFDSFGTVEDVRIPCQQKRMFGFVTFVSADTVKMILAKGNPHFVCGARVLVKPYREKSKIIDRKFDRSENMLIYPPSFSEMEADFYALRNSRMLRKQYQEQQERALEQEEEARRFSGVQLAEKPVDVDDNTSFFNYSLNELNVPEGQLNFPQSEQFSRLFDALNCGSTSAEGNYTDQDSLVLNLPDSPFSNSRANGVSTVM